MERFAGTIPPPSAILNKGSGPWPSKRHTFHDDPFVKPDAVEDPRVSDPLPITVHDAILDAAPDAIVVVDSDGHIVLVNTQAERLFGYSREELIGNAIETLIPQS